MLFRDYNFSSFIFALYLMYLLTNIVLTLTNPTTRCAYIIFHCRVHGTICTSFHWDQGFIYNTNCKFPQAVWITLHSYMLWILYLKGVSPGALNSSLLVNNTYLLNFQGSYLPEDNPKVWREKAGSIFHPSGGFDGSFRGERGGPVVWPKHSSSSFEVS